MGSAKDSLVDPLASMKIMIKQQAKAKAKGKTKAKANSDLTMEETKKLFIYAHERMSQQKAELDEMTYQKNALQTIVYTVQECLK